MGKNGLNFEKVNNKVELNKDLQVIYTHAGIFHADDVFSTALLNIYCGKNLEVRRVFKLPDDEVFAFDIGLGKYDHHQANVALRENGVKYAAFGLLWHKIGAKLCGSEEAAKIIDDNLVSLIDHTDNTGEKNMLSSIISKMNPNWDSEESADEKFAKAVEIATSILSEEIESVKSIEAAREIVETALDNSQNDYVVLPKFAPWQNVLIPSSAQFVIFPSNRGGYNLQVVPASIDSPKAKKDLPEEWLTEKPVGCSFVHQGRFIAAFDTLDEAVKAVESI